MNSSVVRPAPLAEDVTVTDSTIHVVLSDAREIAVPVAWFPRLSGASPTQRANWRMIGRGEGIHWPDVDEDISISSLLRLVPDIHVTSVTVTDHALTVGLKDGRTISAPLAWYPRLLDGTREQRANWQISGAGYGIHWPDLDEDLGTDGLLLGVPAPRRAA